MSSRAPRDRETGFRRTFGVLVCIGTPIALIGLALDLRPAITLLASCVFDGLLIRITAGSTPGN
jgi:hypothetical protein